MSAEVTVVIPTIPPRGIANPLRPTWAPERSMLDRAVASVYAQNFRRGIEIVIECDEDKQGAAATRHRGLMKVKTPYVAFLDDDDELLAEHITKLWSAAEDNSADYVWSWFHVVGGDDPFPQHFGRQWDHANPHQTTITTLVNTDLAKSVGFLGRARDDAEIGGNRWGEDFGFTLGCADAGAEMLHVPERTWLWHHHGNNTSGRPDRW